jgi:hypothetical protein
VGGRDSAEDRLMTTHTAPKSSWMQGRREQRRAKRALTGDSPEKLAERHEPKRDWIDRWLWSGGIERPNRF